MSFLSYKYFIIIWWDYTHFTRVISPDNTCAIITIAFISTIVRTHSLHKIEIINNTVIIDNWQKQKNLHLNFSFQTYQPLFLFNNRSPYVIKFIKAYEIECFRRKEFFKEFLVSNRSGRQQTLILRQHSFSTDSISSFVFTVHCFHNNTTQWINSPSLPSKHSAISPKKFSTQTISVF